jgi:SNF2 family DNA or RNA helicase
MIPVLKEYIDERASPTIRHRARSISLELKSKNKFRYTFSYQGSGKTPYHIVVFFNEETVDTSCSCPYDHGGLCKHQVAALQFIINENKAEVNSKKDKAIIPVIHNEIQLQDHIITHSKIQELAEKNNIHFLEEFYIRITELKENVIHTEYKGWPSSNQVFTYDKDRQVLKVECSCRGSKKKLCLHGFSALSVIVDTFGENIFSPDYVNIRKEEFLKLYGLSLTDDYQKFFDFSLGVEGLKVIEKVKNIAPSVSVASESLLPKLDKKLEDALYVPKYSDANGFQYGVGFCFGLYKEGGIDLFDFIPFKAKYKKHLKEFTSSFKQIDFSCFLSQLKKDVSLSDKHLVLKSFEFDRSYNWFIRSFSVDSYREPFIEFNEFMNDAFEHPFFIKKQRGNRLSKNSLIPIKISSNEYPSLTFTLTESDDFFTLKPKITIEGKSYQTTSSKIKLFPFFVLYNEMLYRFKTPYEFLYISRLQQRGQINFFKQEYDKLYKEFLKPISEHFEINFKIRRKVPEKNVERENLKKQVFLSDYQGEFVVFKLGIQYNETLVLLHSKESLLDEKTQTILKRNDVFETEFLEMFKGLHPDFQNQDDVFFLTPHQLIEDEWLLKTSQKMEQQGITIFGAKELKSFKFNLNKPTVTMNVSSQTDWFDLAIEVKYGNQKVSLKDIRKAILRKDRYITLNDGTLGVLPKEWLQKFSTYFRAGEVQDKSVKISNYQFNIIDELYDEFENIPDFLTELKRKKEQLLNLQQVTDISTPKQLKATLRPYQKEGLKWLSFLEENGLGGCLADDMGLGKTLQVIAFIAYLKTIKKEKSSHLVVVPTSLIFNWESEIKRFYPSLKLLNYTGLSREEKQVSFQKSDVILTTYGTVLNDIQTLKETVFGYVILDESQAIKNPNSKRYKAVRMLQSKNKLALTGTPIENNIFDLYAQMNFLNPGLLGTISHFKTEFADAIDKAKNEEASQLLSKMIHPFLLRRTKEQVATELPEKSETILYCEMGIEQRKVYDLFKEKYRDYLLNKIKEEGAAKSQIYVLEGLTKLRQICNSPELLNEEEDYGKSSVKLDVLIDDIQTKTSNHKILVFSQFTSMLQLIRDRLDNENIAYEYLDGKTQKREEKVKNFQSDETLRVFLISLKAGGVGLNLTAADYVYLVDPWWNPAVESQAIDRSYRIGQTKHVIAYKMICKDTIEEKIVDLQKDKKHVSNSVIQVDAIKKSFNAKEIKDLFS